MQTNSIQNSVAVNEPRQILLRSPWPSVSVFKLILITVLITLLSAATSYTHAAVIYANSSQTNNVPDGTSWSTAFPGVQQAINSANDGDQVWVAAGTYFENLTVVTNVALYGGFAGIESVLGQRNWTNHLTTLDGRGSNSVVLFTAGVTNTGRLDGFVIRNGKAREGGGIFCSNASPAIINNTIIRNQATYGGGVHCTYSSPFIAYNLIQENSAENFGGGVECFFSAATILNNQIVGNFVVGAAEGGGGLYCYGTPPPEVANNLVMGNFASALHSSVSGGIFVSLNCPARIINNTIIWNQGASVGGGVNFGSHFPGEINYPTIANNIVAFGSSGVRGMPGMTFKNNCVFGTNGQSFSGFSNPTGTNGNLSVDPQLMQNPIRPDVHLLAASPCRDAGDDSELQPAWLDIDGGARVVGNSVDIGADEFNGTSPAFVPLIVRVSSVGSDNNDGSTWASAKRTVQAGIDTGTVKGGAELWVAAGIYSEHVTLRHFVYLYGGFSGMETQRLQRNWQANLSVLDADQSGTVVTATNLIRWNTIDGFVIRNGAAARGAGINCNQSSFMIANNLITNNVADFAGGGIHCASSPAFSPPPAIINNTVSFNRAESGGGISALAEGVLIANNHIEGNVAAAKPSTLGAGGGGGIRIGSAEVRNNVFLNNIATNGFTCTFTNDIFTNPWSGGGIGGVPVSFGRPPSLYINNTFLGNQATSICGDTRFEAGGGIFASTRAVIINNLIAFGSSGLDLFLGTVQNNCVFGNALDYKRTNLTGTDGNISVDPLLVAPNDFHLGAGSPCINAGRNSDKLGATDFDGNARIAGSTVDIGAHEIQSPTSVISYAWLQQYGFPNDGPADYLDSDSDLMNNWREWVAGTVPTNAASTLRLLSPTNTGSGITISWQSINGRTYFLERAGDLGTQSPFTLVTSNIVGQADTTSYTDSNATGTGPFFYRVGVQQ